MALPDSEKKNEKKDKPLTKVIIRRLPPTIDQETFLKQVSPIPDYNYIYTVNGDFSLGENAFSRVYVNFVNYEDVFNFKERFDNYVFLDGKGQEYPCVVEFASFQKIPKKRGKTRMDPKAATIESDPYYLDFLEMLKKPQEVDEKPEYTLQLTTNENKNDLTTPLLEFIKNKRAQRMRIRELRREERKRKEFDKKRDYDRDDKKEKSPTKKTHPSKSDKSDEVDDKPDKEKEEKPFEKSYYKTKDRRFEDRKFEERRKEPKPRFPRKEYPGYKSDAPKEKKYDYKKEYESKTFPKKVKKYSEKREERKMEAQKAEQKKLEEAKAEEKKQDGPGGDSKRDKNTPNTSAEDADKFRSDESVDKAGKSKETDAQNQRRIRNKDRPTIAIYRPGMLSKRKQTGEGECSDSKEKPEEK